MCLAHTRHVSGAKGLRGWCHELDHYANFYVIVLIIVDHRNRRLGPTHRCGQTMFWGPLPFKHDPLPSERVLTEEAHEVRRLRRVLVLVLTIRNGQMPEDMHPDVPLRLGQFLCISLEGIIIILSGIITISPSKPTRPDLPRAVIKVG